MLHTLSDHIDIFLDNFPFLQLDSLETPHWFGGFNTTLTWKGLTLYGRFDFALDYWIYDNTTPWFLGCMQGGYNTTTDSVRPFQVNVVLKPPNQ